MNEATTSTDTSPKLAKVMELARKDPGLRLRSLAHVLDEHLLTRAFHQLRKDAAVGVDEVTKEEYGRDHSGVQANDVRPPLTAGTRA